MVSRLIFALDDLEQEIRALCVGNPTMVLRLDGATYDRVVAALADHHGNQMTAGGAAGTTRQGGVNIIRME